MSHGFAHMARGMIAPHAAVDSHSLGLGGARFADERLRLNSIQAMEPAIGSPCQIVDGVVAGFLDIPTIEQHLGGAIGHIVAVGVGNEKQIGQAQQPNAMKAHGHAGEIDAVVEENLASVEMSVAIGVFEDHHPVVSLALPDGIGQTFDHPEPAAIVERHADRLHHVGLAGEERG